MCTPFFTVDQYYPAKVIPAAGLGPNGEIRIQRPAGVKVGEWILVNDPTSSSYKGIWYGASDVANTMSIRGFSDGMTVCPIGTALIRRYMGDRERSIVGIKGSTNRYFVDFDITGYQGNGQVVIGPISCQTNSITVEQDVSQMAVDAAADILNITMLNSQLVEYLATQWKEHPCKSIKKVVAGDETLQEVVESFT